MDMGPEEPLSIRDAATQTGLSIDTLRYYERIGLLEPVTRQTGGHRRYQAGDLHRVEFLSCLRATGMSISKLQRFTSLTREGPSSVPERLALLEAHKVEVLSRIRELEQSLTVVEHKIAYFREQGGKS